jgi:predicted phosphodiesterase
MRILHVSDLHNTRPWFSWVQTNALQYDLIVISGDFLDIFAPSIDAKISPLVPQIQFVAHWLASFPFPQRLLICPGNHDILPLPPEHPLSGSKWLYEASKHILLPSNTAKELPSHYAVSAAFGEPILLPKTTKPLLLLNHAPAMHTSLAKDHLGDFGDPELFSLLPNFLPGTIVFSGHVHDAKHWHLKTGAVNCFNPGVCTGQSVPNHIVIDTKLNRATLYGWGNTITQSL